MILLFLLAFLGSILPVLFIVTGISKPRNDHDVWVVLVGAILFLSILFTAATMADRMMEAEKHTTAEKMP